MKKKIVTVIIVSCLLIIGGRYMMIKKEEEHYYAEQKERIKLYLQYNYNNADDIVFTKTEKNPMGGIFINGYIQFEKNSFSAIISVPGEDFEGNIIINGEFDEKNFKNLKNDYQKDYSVSEILELEKK